MYHLVSELGSLELVRVRKGAQSAGLALFEQMFLFPHNEVRYTSI
jgi:hypothetical protein